MLNLGILISPQDEAEDSLDRPCKRQHGEGAYTSPDTSGAAATGDINPEDKDRGPERMGPPPTPQWDVKTPRPDISIGLSNDAVVNALQLQDLTRKGAKNLLTALAAPDARNGGKPLLCLGSTKQEVQEGVELPKSPVHICRGSQRRKYMHA
ncbi:hypothetical protein BU26DRAFT_171673 [Trematosphaeria pertusa]|uniref:Uncharacterized protein n=1 Tax=Trematosphaeria pertusa TaxID=390896 RepID=A0A6A6HWC1_9PLEO|nr:uncharacterized protein BU26DRAFT_171673 [Trematosphaeria pertusa]KAF2241863.1 hypothetical protein BU26DRAFT_171673 [Trematosphaeria pertusa]